MKPFHFRLERVLAWRRTQLEIEEARYRQKLAAVTALDRERDSLEASGIQAEAQVRAWKPIAGEDLGALSSFRSAIHAREKQIAARREESVKAAGTQLQSMIEAQRRCRALERLKERRSSDWQAANERELEQIATESYLARLTRVRRP